MGRRVIGADEHAFTLETSIEVEALRTHIASCFDRATRADSPKNREALLTFAVVGAGAAGITAAKWISGELKTLENQADSPELSGRLVIVEALSQLMPKASAADRAEAEEHVNLFGGEIHTESRVDQVIRGGIFIGQESFLPTQTVIWTPGASVRTPQ